MNTIKPKVVNITERKRIQNSTNPNINHPPSKSVSFKAGINPQKVVDLMSDADKNRWFEVEENFEVTETYTNENLELGTVFETATVYYDHAPQDRENDCDIQIVTGYMIVKV